MSSHHNVVLNLEKHQMDSQTERDMDGQTDEYCFTIGKQVVQRLISRH